MPTAAQLIRAYARRHRVDPRAALAVARGEGGLRNRPGDIGDLSGGGSYGPFQLYAQGALPSQFRGRPQRADAWAWSPAGINYAIRQMSQAGARGLTGSAAIRAIITRFERPADPASSIQAAIARYGQMAGGGGAAPAAGGGPAAAPVGHDSNPLAMALLARVGGGRDKPSIMDLVQAHQAGQAPMASPSPVAGGPAAGARGGRAAIRPGGGWGGSKGIATGLTRGLGLNIASEKRDTRNTSSGNPSDHWVGSKNAYAYDLSGNERQMDRAARQLLRRIGRADLARSWDGESSLVVTTNIRGYRVQLIYDSPAYGGHEDHMHVGVRRL